MERMKFEDLAGQAVLATGPSIDAEAAVLQADLHDPGKCGRRRPLSGRLDILVKRAGDVMARRPIRDVEDELDQSVVGLMRASSSAVLPFMEAQAMPRRRASYPRFKPMARFRIRRMSERGRPRAWTSRQ
jgi:NAD(P)-dependent dehydrogenase (short-subunit alcohol dehydrogenase family)